MTISLVRIFLALLLAAVPVCLLFVSNRVEARRLAVAVGRMVGQLGLLSLLVWGLYRADSPWLCLLWLLLMSLVVGAVTVRRARLWPRQLALPIAAGSFVSVVLAVVWLLFVVVCPPQPWTVRWLLPLSALLLAQVLPVSVSAWGVLSAHLRAEWQHHEAYLANGQSRPRALLPFVWQSLSAVARPAAASLSVVGLFSLPVLFSGLLLGGVAVVDAAVLTVVVISASLFASVTSVVLSIFLADRLLFNRRGTLSADCQPDVDASQAVDQGQ